MLILYCLLISLTIVLSYLPLIKTIVVKSQEQQYDAMVGLWLRSHGLILCCYQWFFLRTCRSSLSSVGLNTLKKEWDDGNLSLSFAAGGVKLTGSNRRNTTRGPKKLRETIKSATKNFFLRNPISS